MNKVSLEKFLEVIKIKDHFLNFFIRYGPIFALLIFYMKDVYSGAIISQNGFSVTSKWMNYLIACRVSFLLLISLFLPISFFVFWGSHDMLRGLVCATHMDGCLGPKFSKQGYLFQQIFPSKRGSVWQKLAKDSHKFVVFCQNPSQKWV